VTKLYANFQRKNNPPKEPGFAQLAGVLDVSPGKAYSKG
jgi:hypothetical protein